MADFRKKLPRWNPSIYAAFSKVWQMWQLFLTPKDFLKISKSKINFKKTATAATVSKKFSIYAGLGVADASTKPATNLPQLISHSGSFWQPSNREESFDYSMTVL